MSKKEVNSTTKLVEKLLNGASNGLRIGQMMSNVFYKVSEKGKDPYYLSDDELLKAFEAYEKGE